MWVFAGAKGAPGATTVMVAVAACWPDERRRVLVEADPDGGALAARFGVSSEPGLVTLAASTRHAAPPDALARHAAPLGANTLLVAGPPTADQAQAALQIAAPAIARGVADAGDVVFVDAGRAASPLVSPLFEAATAVVLVSRPRLDQLQAVVPTYRRLRDAGRQAGVVLVGEHPYGAGEVAGVLGRGPDAVWGVVPDDHYGAAVLNAERPAGDRGLRRAPLLRAARDLAEHLAAYDDMRPGARDVDLVVDGGPGA